MSKQTVPSFFDLYANEYDLMTDAASREPRHRVEIEKLIDTLHPSVVLDAGCGTGLTTQLFAEKGVLTVGVDASEEMVRLSRERCARFGNLTEFTVSRFESLHPEYSKQFDLVVCLANSLSGIPSTASLMRSLKQFKRVLKSGGSLVIQMLNPALIREGEPFGVKVSRHGETLYHRYASRRGKEISLHIIRTDLSSQPPTFRPFVHTYQPLSMKELSSLLSSAGFGRIKGWGNLVLTEAFKPQSRDMVLIAHRLS